MQTKLIPLEDRVVVRRLEVEDKSPGGIIVPETAAEAPNEGVVLAVGPGKFENGRYGPMPFEVGDTVVFGKWGGTEVVKDGGEELLVIRAESVVCKRHK